MIGLLAIVAAGFFLGMRHATDSDHVIAVTTIVSRQQKISRAALTGIFWGIGHTLTIFVVGSLIILFDIVIPARMGLGMEFSVAIMLIILGIFNVVAFSRSLPSSLSGTHSQSRLAASMDDNDGGYNHNHSRTLSFGSHSHEPSEKPLRVLDTVWGKNAFYQHIRPFVVGVVHGLAGSAAVALLLLTTVRDPYWAIGFLLIFGLGTVVGMMLITMSLASAFHLLGRKYRSFPGTLGFVSGLVSLVFGLVTAYQIGFSHGLFSANAHWAPH